MKILQTILLVFSAYVSNSQKLNKEEINLINYNLEKVATYKCYIISLDSIQRELNRIIISNFDSTYRLNHFANKSTDISIYLKRNGEIKKIVYEKDKNDIISDRKFKMIVSNYIKSLKYFNIAYRDYYGKARKIEWTYFPVAFDKNGNIRYSGW